MTEQADLLVQFSNALATRAEAASNAVVAIRLAHGRHLTGMVWRSDIVVASEQSLPRKDDLLAQADWVNSHKATVQKVVDALVATMRWISSILTRLGSCGRIRSRTSRSAISSVMGWPLSLLLASRRLSAPSRSRPLWVTILAMNASTCCGTSKPG